MYLLSPLRITAQCLLIVVLAGCDSDVDSNAPLSDTPPASVENDAATASQTKSDSENTNTAETMNATCNLIAIGNSGVEGTIEFVQNGDNIKITGEVRGLQPGKHGFHVHEKGDLSDTQTGKSAGGHFNPTDQPHGKPSDEQRHVGDLGNIEAGENGVAKIEMTDDVITLSGPNSIIGRSLMIHDGEDQFTQPTGDAGGRVAFGKIERK